jgi:hypothetical protein
MESPLPTPEDEIHRLRLEISKLKAENYVLRNLHSIVHELTRNYELQRTESVSQGGGPVQDCNNRGSTGQG